ncbi:hypothetical protein FYJ43_02480 [Cutibacterium sp. WCA-380-WT-3A]|uniref:Ribbon-helix-helix protein, CopG family n=1 Tax=Cutibacterium porci TaxID=2605781 RepID=A0A7K0J4S2_9ACTN|nr:hypothetical protein [Cutibacterium porci]MDN6555097.1 hypothetical protein [Acidipropionibacterium acidipropionici]MSS44936.1 hypothetical protein [Cutibacterium porci]
MVSIRTVPHDAPPGVFVRLSPETMKRLDADRTELGLSRAAMLREVYERFAPGPQDEGRSAAAEAVAQAAGALSGIVDRLVAALADTGTAWDSRARQRQSIGVHSNQVAKYANVLRIRAERGETIDADDVRLISESLDAIRSDLARQADAESGDDRVLAGVRRAADDLAAITARLR